MMHKCARHVAWDPRSSPPLLALESDLSFRVDDSGLGLRDSGITADVEGSSH